jgi:ligand-binding SRPBCC domain-containing protein
MQQRFVTSQWVPFTVDLVFAFFSNPHNLPVLMPEKLQTRIERMALEPPPPNPLFLASSSNAPTAISNSGGHQLVAGVGSRIELSFRPVSYVPVRVRWEARITEFVWYSHFCDEQVSGPFDHFHHRHGIRAEMQQGRIGTQLVDEIDFELPLGTMGQLWDTAVCRQLKRTFAMRQERLPRMLDNTVRQMA